MNRRELIALVDCDNFFVSCERLFRPDLAKRPVLVLSSNDACVISRSEEVKSLGVKMGSPYFEVRELCEANNVSIFSSNFELYRDVSERVMSVLRRFSTTVEEYSIDEAFLKLPSRIVLSQDAETFAQEIRNTVFLEIGVPVSIGVANTKTLAKVAAHFAKPRQCGKGCSVLMDEIAIEDALKKMNVGDLWGIGRRLAPKLQRYGVKSAFDLVEKGNDWIQKYTTALGLRLVQELRGVSWHNVENHGSLRKSLVHSQSFGKSVTKFSELASAVAHHARRVAETLRMENILAREVSVMVHTSRHKSVYYGAYDKDVLTVHSSDTLEIVECAMQILKRVYCGGLEYRKVGVLVKDIVPSGAQPKATLFEECADPHGPLMQAIDTLQRRFGDVIKTGVEIEKGLWHAQTSHLSGRHTTRWNEIISV